MGFVFCSRELHSRHIHGQGVRANKEGVSPGGLCAHIAAAERRLHHLHHVRSMCGCRFHGQRSSGVVSIPIFLVQRRSALKDLALLYWFLGLPPDGEKSSKRALAHRKAIAKIA